jgi:hypothetical protein
MTYRRFTFRVRPIPHGRRITSATVACRPCTLPSKTHTPGEVISGTTPTLVERTTLSADIASNTGSGVPSRRDAQTYTSMERYHCGIAAGGRSVAVTNFKSFRFRRADSNGKTRKNRRPPMKAPFRAAFA